MLKATGPFPRLQDLTECLGRSGGVGGGAGRLAWRGGWGGVGPTEREGLWVPPSSSVPFLLGAAAPRGPPCKGATEGGPLALRPVLCAPGCSGATMEGLG